MRLFRLLMKLGGKFVWAIGGWSDLTKTLQENQISAFVEICVSLLKIAGDGIDFDWEHLSEDAENTLEQREVLAKTMLALRNGLDKEEMLDKQIGYTIRFNAFWEGKTRPQGYTAFRSDGEGITIEQTLICSGSSLNNIANWINIMLYDVPPSDLDSPDGFTLETYKTVLESFGKYVNKDKIIIGFEPGGQAAGGKWEGIDVDEEVINYVEENNYGGVMFWAMNQPMLPPSTEITGINAQKLARYAKNIFNKGDIVLEKRHRKSVARFFEKTVQLIYCLILKTAHYICGQTFE